MRKKKAITASEMGKLRWKGINKKDRKAFALKLVEARRAKKV